MISVIFEEAVLNYETTIPLTIIPQPTGDVDKSNGDNDWTDLAQCKGRPRLFFAPRAERPEARYRREARARLVCSQCAAITECRDYARNNHEYGFWGGESEEERHLAGFSLAAPIGIRSRA
jgi:WhiB family transcriptional regulator, redox-sensing transcriptional regulator